MKKLTTFLVTFICLMAVAIAGCGGSATKPAPTVAQTCPAGHASMGCSLKAGPHRKLLRFGGVAPSGCLFPDVYEGQGKVDWNAVARWQDAHRCKRAAIFKLGEFRQDSTAARNASETLRLHFWRAGYWFMHRGVSAAQIAGVARALRIKIIAIDIEVSDANGTGVIAGQLRALGFIVVIYTAPGTWPGGAGFASAPLWQATYGPKPSRWFWTPVLAWQFTDGTFFAPVAIPGIPGTDDVSVDFGITNLGSTPPKPDPFAVLIKKPWKFGKEHASEYTTAITWQKHKCLHPARRTVCKTSDAHLKLLAGRVWSVAHRGKKADWRFHRDTRFHILWTEHTTNKRF